VPTPILWKLQSLLHGRKWDDESIKDQVEFARQDPELLARAKSKAQEIFQTITRFEKIDDKLWPDDPYTFLVTVEILRHSFEREAEEALLELSAKEMEIVERHCKETGCDLEMLLRSSHDMIMANRSGVTNASVDDKNK